MALKKFHKTAEDHKEIISEHIELFDFYKKQRTSYDSVWNKVYKLYNSIVDKKKYPWNSNLFIPISFQIVDNLLPKLLNGNLSFDYMPKSGDDIEKARAMNILVNDYQMPKIKWEYKKALLIKQEVMYGTAWAFPKWAVKQRLKPNSKSKTIFNKDRKIWTPYYKGVDIEVADTFHVWGDARADDETRSTAIVYEDMEHLDTFMNDYEDELKKARITREDLENSFKDVVRKYSDLRYDKNEINISSDIKVNYVFVMRVFYDNRWVIIANRSYGIMDIENPSLYNGKPVCRVVSQPMKSELYGKSLLDVISSLQFELNDIRNQRMDNVKLIMDRMIVAPRGGSLNPSQMTTAPGKIWWVDEDTELDRAFKFVDTPDISTSGLYEEDKLYRDFERTSGLSDFQAGLTAVEGATVSSLLESKLSDKLNSKTKLIADSGLHSLGMQIAALNEQYMKKEVAVRIVGEDGKWEFPDSHKVSPDMLTSDLDLNVSFSPSQEFQKPQIRNFLVQMMPYLRMDPNINTKNVWQYIFDDLSNIKANSGFFDLNQEKTATEDDRIEAYQARKENNKLDGGQMPRASKFDNHLVHKIVHNIGLDAAGTPDSRDRYKQHIAMHNEYVTGAGKEHVAAEQNLENPNLPSPVQQTFDTANQTAQNSGMSPSANPNTLGDKRAYTRGSSSNVPNAGIKE